jgi:hypothetical protein
LRNLAKACAQGYVEHREAEGFPLLKKSLSERDKP